LLPLAALVNMGKNITRPAIDGPVACPKYGETGIAVITFTVMAPVMATVITPVITVPIVIAGRCYAIARVRITIAESIWIVTVRFVTVIGVAVPSPISWSITRAISTITVSATPL
jgi:hypothetical protein